LSPEAWCPITEDLGKWALVGRKSEAAVVLVEPVDNITTGDGKSS
jgi:hypothetical protein